MIKIVKFVYILDYEINEYILITIRLLGEWALIINNFLLQGK
jgi:hypothetical protein